MNQEQQAMTQIAQHQDVAQMCVTADFSVTEARAVLAAPNQTTLENVIKADLLYRLTEGFERKVPMFQPKETATSEDLHNNRLMALYSLMPTPDASTLATATAYSTLSKFMHTLSEGEFRVFYVSLNNALIRRLDDQTGGEITRILVKGALRDLRLDAAYARRRDEQMALKAAAA